MSAILETLALQEPIFKKYGLTYVGLFGSQSRGESTPLSDVDLLFDYERPFSLFTLVELKQTLTKSLGKEVDLVSRRSINKHMRSFIEKDVLTVYEQ